MQQRRAMPRCRVCRLKPDALAEVHRERLAWNLTYEELAQKLRSSGHSTSTSALRRHFKNHARNLEIEGDQIDSATLEEVATPFDALVTGWISEKAVAETLVRSLLQRMQELERQQRTVRDPPTRERLASRHLQTLAALERALKRLQEMRQPERDVKKLVAEALHQATVAIIETYKAAMREQIAALKQWVYDSLDKKVRPEDFLGQIKRWEEEWPATMANRIGETLILSFRAAGAQA